MPQPSFSAPVPCAKNSLKKVVPGMQRKTWKADCLQVHPFETPEPEMEAGPSLSLTVLSQLDHFSGLLPPPQLLTSFLDVTLVLVCPFLSRTKVTFGF